MLPVGLGPALVLEILPEVDEPLGEEPMPEDVDCAGLPVDDGLPLEPMPVEDGPIPLEEDIMPVDDGPLEEPAPVDDEPIPVDEPALTDELIPVGELLPEDDPVEEPAPLELVANEGLAVVEAEPAPFDELARVEDGRPDLELTRVDDARVEDRTLVDLITVEEPLRVDEVVANDGFAWVDEAMPEDEPAPLVELTPVDDAMPEDEPAPAPEEEGRIDDDAPDPGEELVANEGFAPVEVLMRPVLRALLDWPEFPVDMAPVVVWPEELLALEAPLLIWLEDGPEPLGIPDEVT
jgi:nicotinate-nucleotide--dimethylbenzimidazole phosphoribosyltransferase